MPPPTVLLLLLLTCASCRASSDDPASRARAMLQKMTLEEKITMCHGGPTKCAQQQRACLPAPKNCNILRRYTGEIAGNDRLNIPPLRMNDGPQGFRTSDGSKGTSTAWPSALTLAATFDTQLAGEWGRAMGQEFRDKGAGMQLGPGVNVARLPECGRNFEYTPRFQTSTIPASTSAAHALQVPVWRGSVPRPPDGGSRSEGHTG